MANSQERKNGAPPQKPGGDRAREIAQDLESLRVLAARLRHLAPSAQESVLRAILGKREALLGSISARLGRPAGSGADAADADSAPKPAAMPRSAFAETLGEIAAMDRESARVLRKRSDDAAAEIHKLRAGRKWRQSNTP